MAAIALLEALQAVMGDGPAYALKWPNDVLVNSGKVAGILLESLFAKGHFVGIAVGIGVNLIAAPGLADVEAGAVPPVSVKGESGADVTPDVFLSHLAPAYAQWDARLTTYGFGPIRNAWLTHAARLGETITARLPKEDVTGRFETLDENGYLVLNTPKGRRAITAADVYF